MLLLRADDEIFDWMRQRVADPASYMRRLAEIDEATMLRATDTLRLFVEYDWPGNVRELENLVKRMVILGTDTSIRREVADAIAGRALRVGPIPVLEQAATALQHRRHPGLDAGVGPSVAARSGRIELQGVRWWPGNGVV